MVNRTGNRLPQNKANSPPWAQTGAGRGSRRQSDRAGELRQTNPIRGRWAGKTIVKAEGLGDATREGQTCETNPMSGGAGRDEAIGTRDVGCRANKANWPERSCETNPISGSLTQESAVQTKPIRRAPTGTADGRQGRTCCRRRGQSCETKPICGRQDGDVTGRTGAQAYCAKQTQFAADGQEDHRQSLPRAQRMCRRS
jgi:hypothetical protein